MEPKDADWGAMMVTANQWRGQCLQAFARSERAVSDTLVWMANGKADGSVTLPLVIGCRYTELKRLLGAAKTPAATKALPALLAFRGHDRLRVFLCHGQASVLRDRKGDWKVALQLLAFRNGVAVIEDRLLSQPEMQSAAAALNRDGQRLVSLLTVLRAV